MAFPIRLQTHNGNNVPLGLYKDVACTVPATADGDLIAAWRDELGTSGLVATQSSSGSRPILRFVPSSKGGNMPVLEFDGVDDVLTTTTALQFTTPGSIYFSYMFTGGGGGFIAYYPNQPQQIWLLTGGGTGRLYVDGTVINSDRNDVQWQRQAMCCPTAGHRELRRYGTVVSSGTATDANHSTPLIIGQGFRGYIGSIIFSDVGPFDSSLDTNIAALGAFLETRTNIVWCDGDSITAGDRSTGQYGPYPAQLQTLLGNSYRVLNSGVPSQQLSDMISDAAAEIDANWPASATRKMVVCFSGTNDLFFGSSPATVQSRLTTYWGDRRAAGDKVIAVTILPRSGNSTPVGFEAARQTVNAWIRANPTLYDALVDVAADSRMGDAGDELNLTYYSDDQCHPVNAGYTVIASLVKTAIDVLEYNIGVETRPQNGSIYGEQFTTLATKIAQAVTNSQSVVPLLQQSVEYIAAITDIDPTYDLIIPFEHLREDQSRSISSSNGGYMPVVRALYQHVLLRARQADGNVYENITDWFDDQAALGYPVSFPQTFADLSATAGYVVDDYVQS